MKSYLITWNAGYGESGDVIEAASRGDAALIAYEACLEEFESNAEYGAEEITAERLENFGFGPEDYGLERTE